MTERTVEENEAFNRGYIFACAERETKGIAAESKPTDPYDAAIESIGREIVRTLRADVARTLAQHREQVTALKQRIDELETMVLELTERK